MTTIDEKAFEVAMRDIARWLPGVRQSLIAKAIEAYESAREQERRFTGPTQDFAADVVDYMLDAGTLDIERTTAETLLTAMQDVWASQYGKLPSPVREDENDFATPEEARAYLAMVRKALGSVSAPPDPTIAELAAELQRVKAAVRALFQVAAVSDEPAYQQALQNAVNAMEKP